MARFSLKRLFGEPISQGSFSTDQRSNILFSQILIFTAGLFLINLLQDLLGDTIEIWGPDMVMVVIIAFLYLIHLKGLHLVSKVLSILIMNLAIFYFAAKTENRNSVATIFFPVAACSFLIFGIRILWVSVLFSFVTLGLLFYLEINRYHIAFIRAGGVPNVDMASVIINIFSAFFIQMLTMFVLLRSNTIYEKNLIEKKENLEKVNEELDRFMYSISHDLKAPLSSIKGLINIARKETSVDQLNQYFMMINQSVEKLERFIFDVTNYTRNTRLQLQLEPINFKNLLMNIWSNLSYIDDRKQVRLDLDLPANPVIQSDKVRLTIILNNILSNSIKYQDPNKPFSDRFVKVKLLIGSSDFKITIHDNGIGIPESHTGNVFNMFYRASEQSKGSGLGLFIVKETVEKMSGSIRLESKIGEGTIIGVTIPRGK